MKLVEQHIIKKSNADFKKIDNLCWLSKNLYNAALYHIKQHFEATGKWIRYNDLEKDFSSNNNPDYRVLPPATSQQILMVVDKNLKSYFALLKKYKKNKKSLLGCPKFPKYKHKIKGRNILIFTNQQARHKPDKSIIRFPKLTELHPLKTKVQGKLNQVRIIPTSGCYKIEVVYEKPEEQLVEPNNNYLSIDLGLNNLMACYDSQDSISLIVPGKPLKSMNQYYNKKKSKLQTKLKKNHNKYVSRKIKQLSFKRNNKIKDYLHKSSRFIVDYCLESGISNIVLGYNLEWKQGINLGKKTNQNFVQIPFATLINQIQYKAKLVGITVTLNEESYTSKCSALDLEEVCKHEIYLGKRIKRGLFVSSNGTKINADLNGAINILRKVTGDKVFGESHRQTQTSRGQVRWPLKINLYKN